MIEFFETLSPVMQAFIATLFTWSVTALGASIVFFFKKINKSIMDSMLGFAAGVMIAASFLSLLAPAIEMAESLKMIPWLIVTIGFIFGGLLLFVGDKIYDIQDRKFNKGSKKEKSSMKRCIMLISSITLHNIPDGLL